MFNIQLLCMLLFATNSYVCADNMPEDGYKFTTPQGSYVLHKEVATWQQAKERCAGAGAELWVPADKAEQRAVRGEVDRVSEYAVWTGVNDLDHIGTYRAPDGRPLSIDYIRWGLLEPKSVGEVYRCVALFYSSLFVINCTSTHLYVCRLPAASPPASTTSPSEHN